MKAMKRVREEHGIESFRGVVGQASSTSPWQWQFPDQFRWCLPRRRPLLPLCRAGYNDVTRAFYQFCAKAITREGYFLQKYRPDGSQGSSWHPWVLDGNRQFPIQEDETALVVWALWQHFETYRDVEFIKPLFRPLITSAADFIVRYRDQGTGLPLPSYDLWEERRGILSFTCAAVYGGLILEPLQ